MDTSNTKDAHSRDVNLEQSNSSASYKSEKPSWFRSLKRSLTKRQKKTSNLTPSSDCQGDPTGGVIDGRLNKSDWDLRREARGWSESVPRLDMEQLSLNSGAGGELQDSNSLMVPHPQLYYTIDARRLASRHKKSQQDRQLLYGVKQFNLDPKEGLKYLEEKGFLRLNPENIAKFLFEQDRLSKRQIGNYLGSRDEFQQSVLVKFVSLHQFTDLLLVQALRQFLWSFRLPGEAQQIDRVMSTFAQHYCHQNTDSFSNSDTVYILSFAIIMLNTALHNKNVKIKITEEQFVAQNKGIDSGKDLPVDMLEAIYRNIKEQPFKIPDENYDDLMFTFFSPDREGWLVKQGGSWKSWKRRWFVLSDRCLYYFQHTAENVPKGIIPLENVSVRPVAGEGDRQWQFEIYSSDGAMDTVKGCKTDKGGTVVVGNHKVYKMSANTEEERDEWIRCLQEAMRDNSVHKIISERREAFSKRTKSQQENCDVPVIVVSEVP